MRTGLVSRPGVSSGLRFQLTPQLVSHAEKRLESRAPYPTKGSLSNDDDDAGDEAK